MKYGVSENLPNEYIHIDIHILLNSKGKIHTHINFKNKTQIDFEVKHRFVNSCQKHLKFTHAFITLFQVYFLMLYSSNYL